MEFDKSLPGNFFKLDRYSVSADRNADEATEENEATIKILVPAAAADGKCDRMLHCRIP